MSDPFAYIKAINEKSEVDDMSGFDPYLTTHSFSAFPETALLANEMNIHATLPKHMQFDFFFHSVRKGKRFAKWLKKNKNETHENIQLIRNHYGYSAQKARQALDILRPDQLEWIRNRSQKGGRK